MKKIQKLLPILLIALLMLSLLSACGGNSANEPQDEPFIESGEEAFPDGEAQPTDADISPEISGDDSSPDEDVPAIPLSQAFADGSVELSVMPCGINTFLLSVTNTSDAALRLEPELAGSYYLHSESDEFQDLLITYIDENYLGFFDGYMQLEPGETKECGGDCACMNISRSIPDDTCGYTLEVLNDGTLSALVTLFREEETPYEIRQAAVWIVTDDADEQDVQILTVSVNLGTPEALISAEDYAQALLLVERARDI